MRLNSISGKLAQLKRADPSLWAGFVSGWLLRHRNQFVPCVVPGCRRLLKVPLRDFYESYFFFCEDWQGRAELDFFLAHLRPGEVFYDVGAYRGAYLAALKLKLQENGSVHAFDPIAGNIEAVRKIARLNGFDPLKIHQQAVGRGTVLAGNICGDDFMFRAGAKLNEASTGRAEFPTMSLDDYVAGGEPPPTLIKIDVEGFELEVLLGARAMLTRHRPRLWLEIHPNFLEGQGKSADAVMALLHEIGYTVSFFKDFYSPATKISHHVWCE
jgi:FkbM family methyltransferase